jgi:hypothetical protein
MGARIPQDVDLEDRLIYGLTPVRLGYLVIAALAALSVWGLRAVPPALRAVPCGVIVTVGVGLAWGRWAGRPADRWVADVAVFVRRNYRIRLPRPGLRWPRRRAVAPEVVPVPLGAINDLAAARADRTEVEAAA